jgi:CTP:molybdopterin cytidylyltransferase MocA
VRAVCAILAAGRSTRMGEPKLVLPVAGETLVARALAAAAAYPRVAVVSPALAPHVAAAPGLVTILNDEPERGMAHSLRLANAALGEPDAALVVLLGDTPFVDAALVDRILAARGDADVAYPARDGVPGHPVVFGPCARAAIAGLPDGDTLRSLRADPRWTRIEIATDDDAPFADVDTPADFARIRARVEPSPSEANS